MTASLANLPVIQSYHPATFLERGVAVPFTTPALLGTRARAGGRNGTELLVPSPVGGRGIYIVPWSSAHELYRPTVHDARLNEIVCALPIVTPSLIRHAARQVASEGLAGRDAAAAAAAASREEREERLLTNFLLLLTLLEQVDPSAASPGAEQQNGGRISEERARRALIQAAPRIGQLPETIAAMLEEMAPHFTPVGVGDRAKWSRISRVRDSLAQLQSDMAEWASSHTDESGAQAAFVARVAGLTVSCTDALLSRSQAIAGDMLQLLRDWGTEPSQVREKISRPEWLLDGWQSICDLWTTSDTAAARCSALSEISLMVPTIPREASDWIEVPIDTTHIMGLRRPVNLNEDRRTGTAVFETIARNERLRAMAA